MVTRRTKSAQGGDPRDVEARLEQTNREGAALVSQILEDPERGLAGLYERYSRDVNRLVWRLLGPDGEHEDIVQQVFLQMMRSIATVRTPERLGFWVRSITVNVVRSELRRRSVRRIFSRDQALQDERSGDLVVDVESREFVMRSREVLDKLPEKERTVFLLYYLEELSLPEVAEICGFSTMTAKRRLQGARVRFHKLVQKQPLLRDLAQSSGVGDD